MNIDKQLDELTAGLFLFVQLVKNMRASVAKFEGEANKRDGELLDRLHSDLLCLEMSIGRFANRPK